MAKPKGVFYEQLGQKLTAVRRDRRVTQGRLAAAVDLSRTSITNIEKGRQVVPVHVLARMARTLNVPVTDLIPSPEADPGSTRVERQLSSLDPEQQAWAKKVLAVGLPSQEDSHHATSLRSGSKKGSGVDSEGKDRASTRPRRKTR